MDWYALFVRTGDEHMVERYLNYHFDKSECTTIIPKSRIVERTKGKRNEVLKPLFPGYILINTTLDNHMYYIIKQVPKVYRILRQAEEYYTNINPEEMKPILKLIDEKSVIDYSKIFIENSIVYVKEGPLQGMEGIIKRVDKRKGRATIALDFMGESRMINLGVEILTNHCL